VAAREYLPERRGEILFARGPARRRCTERDMAVGPHEDGAVGANPVGRGKVAALVRPVPVGTDRVGRERDSEAHAGARGGIDPGATGRAGKDREAGPAEVERRAPLAAAPEPYVRRT